MNEEAIAEEKRISGMPQRRKRELNESVTESMFQTSDEFYAELCRSKAKNFAILGDAASL